MAYDLETEPDYPVTLKCIECGDRVVLSGEFVEFHGIDNTNYVCIDCAYLFD